MAPSRHAPGPATTTHQSDPTRKPPLASPLHPPFPLASSVTVSSAKVSVGSALREGTENGSIVKVSSHDGACPPRPLLFLLFSSVPQLSRSLDSERFSAPRLSLWPVLFYSSCFLFLSFPLAIFWMRLPWNQSWTDLLVSCQPLRHIAVL
ncbi:uncharacterized protein N7518_004468 [Penicillium psychrosexuale]|uniref:uncharacterized protein n=1 Tax=Penicillium psychrosexuale TaxID=1002107 RepID=UPI0025458BD2|nr:uncharacterized protein N7518_004468 [Penicillium psychrosexuale]KAJ5795928.1 hypothetical protein N7518_004468 [Penicillium psychrosexuale]